MGAGRWYISQIGARQHYAVPRALALSGQLARFDTDIWWPPTLRIPLIGGKAYKRLSHRYHPDLDPAVVHARNLRYIAMDFAKKFNGTTKSAENLYRFYNKQGKQFAQSVRRGLQRDKPDTAQDVFFGFTSASLETLQWTAEQGMCSITDQIAPGLPEEQLVAEERERWAGWEQVSDPIPNLYWERQKQEWDTADIVLVNSPWSKSALIQQGVRGDKITVIPHAYEVNTPPAEPNTNTDDPLHVLWLGSVILRKGIPYLIDAARELVDQPIKFTIAGPIAIADHVVRDAPPNMDFIGQVPRAQAADLYRSADVFVLPTISDGFAITQIEAMTYGLPVIATPNCGQVVEDGISGKIVPIRDAPALADALRSLARDRDLLAQMSTQAANHAKLFTLKRYHDSVIEAVKRHRAGQPME